jgi:DNA invertase Pin-like site-specific DNA recombinase
MIAAIYARKSTEQTGVADEDKSVARQVEHATAYATRKGWTVDEGTWTTGSAGPSSSSAPASSAS